MTGEKHRRPLDLFRADCAAAGTDLPTSWLARPAIVLSAIRNRSLRVILLIRLMQGTPRWLSHLWRRALLCHGCDVPRESSIGPGLRMPNAYGVVLGVNTTLGRDVTLHQNVSIGPADRDWRRRPGGRSGQARIGDRVEVQAGAVIFGTVEIGDDCRIGPLSVVNRSLPACTLFANALTVAPEQLEQQAERRFVEPSPGARLASLLARWGAAEGDGGPAARRALVELFQTTVGTGSTIAVGSVPLPRHVTIDRADIRPGARLGSRVTIESADGSAMAVIGEDALVEPGAVIIGPVTVPAGSVVRANHLLLREQPMRGN